MNDSDFLMSTGFSYLIIGAWNEALGLSLYSSVLRLGVKKNVLQN